MLLVRSGGGGGYSIAVGGERKGKTGHVDDCGVRYQAQKMAKLKAKGEGIIMKGQKGLGAGSGRSFPKKVREPRFSEEEGTSPTRSSMKGQGGMPKNLW